MVICFKPAAQGKKIKLTLGNIVSSEDGIFQGKPHPSQLEASPENHAGKSNFPSA